MESVVKTVCPYCGVGCGLAVKVRDGQITEVRGDKDHPSTRGGICPKGAQIDQIIHTKNRAASALWRDDRAKSFEPIGLDGALARLADKFMEIIREHGPDAVGFYVSGQLTTES